MSQLLAKLQAGGEFDSRGHFSLDGEKARQKMGRFQLTAAARFLVELVAAAHDLGATSMSVDSSQPTLRIQFNDLRPFEAGMPHNLGEHLLTSNSPWQRLAVALNAAASHPGIVIELLGGDQSFVWDSASASPPWPAGLALAFIRVSNLSGLDRPKVLHEFTQATAWSSLPLFLNQTRRPVREIHSPWGLQSLEVEGQPATMGLSDNLQDKELIIVQDGLAYRPKKVPFKLPVRVLLHSDGRYALDASYAEIIEDAALTQTLTALDELSWGVVNQSLKDPAILHDLMVLTRPMTKFCLSLAQSNSQKLPRVRQLPLFPVFHRKAVSIEELGQMPDPLHYCRDASVLCPEEMTVLQADSLEVWLALQALLKGRLEDATATLKQRQEYETNRAKFMQRPLEKAVILGESLVTSVIEGPGFSGHMVLNVMTRTPSLRVLLRGRELTTVQVDSPYPFTAVLDFQELEVRPDWKGVTRGEAYTAALAVLRDKAQELNRSLATGALQPEARNFVVRLLLEKERPLDLFRNTPLILTLSGQLQSIQQIEEALQDGFAVGFVPANHGLSDKIPPGCWGCDVMLVLSNEDERLLKKSFPKTWSKATSQLDAMRREHGRFSEVRSPQVKLPPDGVRLNFKGGELALTSSPGALEVEILKQGVSLGKRVVPSILAGGTAVVELPTVVPNATWRDFSLHDPAWLEALKAIKEAEIALLTHQVTHFLKYEFTHHWRAMMQELALQGFDRADQLPVFAAVPAPVSLAVLISQPTVNYGSLAPGMVLSEAGLPFLLEVDRDTLSQLQRKFPQIEWIDARGAIDAARLRSDFMVQLNVPLKYGKTAVVAVDLPAPLKGQVGLGNRLQGDIRWHHLGRPVEILRKALPPGLEAMVESPTVEINSSYDGMMRTPPWEEHLELVKAAALSHLKDCLAQPQEKPTLELALGWLPHCPSELESMILQLKVVPTLKGHLSLEEYRTQGKLEGNYLHVRNSALLEDYRKNRGKENLPAVVDSGSLDLSALQRWIGTNILPGNDFLIRELRAWTLQQSLQTLQKNFPSCWGEAQLGDYGRLGVPRDGTRQVFYLEREELSQNTPPFPLVGYSLRSLNPGEFMEGAARAYLAVLEGGRFDAKRRSALVAFFAEYAYAIRDARPPACLKPLMDAQWFPAEGRARVSLLQLMEWGGLDTTAKAFPYLAAEGVPEQGWSFPLPILENEQEQKLLRNLLRRRLEEIPRRSLWKAFKGLAAAVYKQVALPDSVEKPQPMSVVAPSKLEKRAQRAREREEKKPQPPPPPNLYQRLLRGLGLETEPGLNPAEATQPDQNQADPESELLRVLRREANLLAPKSARRELMKELDKLQFGRYLFGPLSWRDSDGNLRLNRTHADIRTVVQKRERDPGCVLHLLIYLVGVINLHLEGVTDQEELDFLGILEENLLKSYPEGLVEDSST